MKILVTGATGSVGRMVVDHLVRAGAADVRAMVSRPERVSMPAGVEVVEGYVGRPESLPAALEGVDRMYLAPYVPTIGQVVPMIERAGVHLVDLSGPPDNHWSPICAAIEASSVTWTHLWAGQFMDNFLTWAEQIRATGRVRDAYPESADTAIAMDDIAAVAARVLLSDGHEGKAYELSGPEAVTRAERVRLIGEAIGQEVPYDELTHEEAVAALTPSMGDFAITYVDFLRVLVDHPMKPTTTVADLLGRPGTGFDAWARQRADEFRPAATA